MAVIMVTVMSHVIPLRIYAACTEPGSALAGVMRAASPARDEALPTPPEVVWLPDIQAAWWALHCLMLEAVQQPRR